MREVRTSFSRRTFKWCDSVGCVISNSGRRSHERSSPEPDINRMIWILVGSERTESTREISLSDDLAAILFHLCYELILEGFFKLAKICASDDLGVVLEQDSLVASDENRHGHAELAEEKKLVFL